MLDFSVNEGVIGKLMVSGSVTDMLTDVTTLVSVLYGSIAKKDKEQADHFRTGIMALFVDRELHDKVFSTEYIDMLEGSKMYKTASGQMDVDMEELIKQLKELRDILKDKDEDEDEESDDESE